MGVPSDFCHSFFYAAASNFLVDDDGDQYLCTDLVSEVVKYIAQLPQPSDQKLAQAILRAFGKFRVIDIAIYNVHRQLAVESLTSFSLNCATWS